MPFAPPPLSTTATRFLLTAVLSVCAFTKLQVIIAAMASISIFFIFSIIHSRIFDGEHGEVVTLLGVAYE
jgi:hypothetical protein